MKRIALLALIVLSAILPFETSALATGGDRLYIDDTRLYDGMEKTYAQGYVPKVEGGKATIVLPLIGRSTLRSVSLKADLGAPENSPFEFVNLSRTLTGREPFVFTLEIPLSTERKNGSYPVVLTAECLDASDVLTQQQFTVYVSITDGAASTAQDAIAKPAIIVKSCAINPATVGGDEEFTVSFALENIGEIPAHSICLTYGGVDNAAIVSAETNGALYFNSIASGETATATVALKTTRDVVSGNWPFFLTLDYADANGGAYTLTRQFLAPVTQPTRVGFDPISVPKSIAAGETMTLPVNVFNTGKSTLGNVRVTVTGAGLFPTSSVFLGDIAPGDAKNGKLTVFIGMLSMTEGYSEAYGNTNGVYTITCLGDDCQEHSVTQNFTTEILKPIVKDDEADNKLTSEPAFQWWLTILAGLAIIAIVVSGTVVTKITRALKIR